MNHGTKTLQLPELTANILREGGCLVDKLFADVWKRMGMKARLNRLGFHKRSGTQAAELVYCLMILVWLKVDAIGMFARESLRAFSRAKRRSACSIEPRRQELAARSDGSRGLRGGMCRDIESAPCFCIG